MTPSQIILKKEQDKLMFLKRKCSQRSDVHGDYHKQFGPRKVVEN